MIYNMDMSMTFTKLFSSITESTVWCEDSDTRVVWITMLAMSDKHGRVFGSVPGLAKNAVVSLEACIAALEKFSSPDEWSRTKEHEGRRIEEIDGGWRLLNHGKFRDMRDAEERKAYKADWIRNKRASVDNVDKCRPQSTHTDTDTDTDTDKPKTLNQSAWNDYQQHRKDLRAKKLTKRGTALAMKKLATLPPGEQQAVVDNSISNGWIGLFPEKRYEKNTESFDELHARTKARAGLS